jgi:hypothetical protein
MSANMYDLPLGARTFQKDQQQYGYVQRTSLLGLSNTPVVLVDDGSLRAYAGAQRVQVVDKAAGVDLFNEPTSLPMDVYDVGFTQLTAAGFSVEQQKQIYTAWVALPSAEKDSWTAQWDALDPTDTAAANAFVQGLVGTLMTA